MKKYEFGGIEPNNIFRVFRSDDYKQIEIVTVIGHSLFIKTETKEEYYNCVDQLRQYCSKKRIGVTVRGYNEKE